MGRSELGEKRFWQSLVEYLCTQGLLTLVAGESHAQACFGPCCMSVFEVNDDEE